MGGGAPTTSRAAVKQLHTKGGLGASVPPRNFFNFTIPDIESGGAPGVQFHYVNSCIVIYDFIFYLFFGSPFPHLRIQLAILREPGLSRVSN